MFRGAPGLSADQLAEIGSIMGGEFNADTRQAVTQYLYSVPAEDVDIALHIEALRMRGVDDSAAGWQRERGAIEQEVAQDLSSPSYVMYTRLRGALFEGTTYAHDALGTRPSFDKTSAAMLKDFYARWYAPNNAVLLVVGDVDPPAVMAQVERLFGAIPRKTLPARPDFHLQPVRAQSMSLDSDLPYDVLVVAMRMPGTDSPDYAACELLADVVGSQRGALYGLVPQGKALSAGFNFDALAKGGIGYATATFPAGADGQALEREVRGVLAAIARDGVSADLVAAAKRQERLAAEAQKTSIGGLASAWTEAVAVEGLDSPDEGLARIEKVTVEDVDRAARRYLDLDHAVVARLDSRPGGKPVSGRGFGGTETVALGQTRATALPDWAQPLLGSLKVPDSTLRPVVSRLPNGITLVVQPETVSDTVSVYGHIKNLPELQVPAGKEGVSAVLDGLFSYGSEHLDRLAFQRALDDIGAEEQAGVDFEMSVLREHFAQGLALLADNELHPAIADAAFKTVREQVEQTVAGRLKSPGYLAERGLAQALFPKSDPSLREALPQTVAALSLADVRNYYRAAFRPDLAIIVVIGHISPGEALDAVEKSFGAWQAQGERPDTTLPAVPMNGPARIAVPDASRVQDSVTLAETLDITRSSPDYYALRLGNTVLGGGFYAARLSRDIRKNAGLVYSISSQLDAGKKRSVYLVEYACDPPNVAKVHASVERELQKMREAPVDPGELQRAKALLLHQLPMDESSEGAIAQGFIARWNLDLPLDEATLAAQRYLALTAEQIEAAFRSRLRPDDLVRVAQGPAPK